VLSADPLEHVDNFAAIDAVYVAGARIQAHIQESPRVPAEPMSYRGAAWLEREDRYEEERPELVLDAMELEPGDVVADVGTGSGFYARQIASRVMPGGRVYAVDIQPEMLELLGRLIDEEGVTGVVPVLSEPDDPKLPAGDLDWILLADVYHEIAEPEPVLEKMRAALAPEGRVALLEYRVEDGTGDHVKADHVMSVRQVLSEWRPAGFELVELHEFLPTQHMFVFGAGANGGIRNYDFLDAVAGGIVDAEVTGGVSIRLRRTVGKMDGPIVITMPVGTAFVALGRASEMIARRDAAILLDEDGWQNWNVRAVRRERFKPAPSNGDVLVVQPPPHSLRALMRAIQVGTYTFEGRLTYPVRTVEIEQAALWIADEDARYRDMADDIEGDRIPAEYAAAFALMLCDAAGIDVTERRIWEDGALIFDSLREPSLQDWYVSKLEP